MNDFNNKLNDNQYFKSLPAYVQETIKQSGVSFNSEQELKNCAENLLKNNLNT